MTALAVLPGRLAVCRLPEDTPIELPAARPVSALVARAGELTLVCAEDDAPAGARVQGGWCALEVACSDLTGVTGVLAGLATPLAQAGISVFAMATFDTDVLLVQEEALEHAVAALRVAGHRVDDPI